MRHVDEPVTSAHDRGGTVTTHPAFGQIVAHRVTGSASLYGSDFRHHAYMVVTIQRSELHRDLHHDWHRATGQLIEVAMSEAQWATFISSVNVGGGVPCTIDRVDGKLVPALPDPQSRADQFGDEMREDMAEMLDKIHAAIKALDDLGVSKKKSEPMRCKLEAIERDLRSNLPFVAKSFGEHVEETVEKAKVEIHGYMVQTIQRAGLEALEGNLPLQITDGATGE